MNNGKNSNNNQKIIDAIVSSSGGKIDRTAIDSALGGDMSRLMNSLSAEDRQKLSNALKDEKSAKQVLSSDAARQLINMFLNGGR